MAAGGGFTPALFGKEPWKGKKGLKENFQVYKCTKTAHTRSDSLAEIFSFAVTGLFRTLAPMGAATGAGERARSRKEPWRGFTSI